MWLLYKTVMIFSHLQFDNSEYRTPFQHRKMVNCWINATKHYYFCLYLSNSLWSYTDYPTSHQKVINWVSLLQPSVLTAIVQVHICIYTYNCTESLMKQSEFLLITFSHYFRKPILFSSVVKLLTNNQHPSWNYSSYVESFPITHCVQTSLSLETQ